MSTERTYGPTALMTPANMMTAFRLVVAPYFIYLIIFDRISWWTTVVGLSVAASDYFDGIVARRHGTTTSGAFLDPLADKVIVLGGLYAIIITLREIWMSVFRARAARQGISIPASRLAKWKTFAQDWGIGFCVLPITGHHLAFAFVTIWIAVALTVYTGWQYYHVGKRVVASAS